MSKIDLRKDLKALYQPSAKAVVDVRVPSMTYLMIDGEGDPNTSKAFAAAVEALYAVSYAVKFMVKRGPSAIDYTVMPLEGLWWADDMSRFMDDRSRWKWTLMIMHPAFVPRKAITAAIGEVNEKKRLPALAKVRVATLKEGRCAQILHRGPFSDEGPTIARVHAFIAALGKRPVGKHHEIYLTDMRKATPARWKTVIRQPMG